jgi:hypothetical protein
MFNWFIDYLERNGRHRIIMDRTGKVPYMHRYYLLFKGKLNEFDESERVPFNIMLHHIVLSDQDGFHDHPWWYFTLILKGGYYEHRPIEQGGSIWRGPGHFRISRPDSLHKLELPYPGASAWTLFIKGPKVREWGFIRPDGQWEYWRTYLQQRYGKNKPKVHSAKLAVSFGEPIIKRK